MSGAAAAPRGPDLWRLCAGFVVWSLAFVVLYGGLSVGCRFGWSEIGLGPIALDRALLVGAWILHAAAGLWLLAAVRRLPAGGLRRAIVWSTASAAAATVWIGLPILVTSTCT